MSNSSGPTLPAYLIDPPSPFDTAEIWQKFLQEMEFLPQSDPIVAGVVEEARETLARKAAEAQS